MGAFLPWYTFTAVILLAIHGGLCVDIIGGNEVAPHSRPFMAQIKGRREIICGGALIKENWVLTAAHCKTYTVDCRKDSMWLTQEQKSSKQMTGDTERSLPCLNKLQRTLLVRQVPTANLVHPPDSPLIQFPKRNTRDGYSVKYLKLFCAPGNKRKVILGAHSSKKREKEQQVFQIAKHIPHPRYDPSTKENDIMLLQLQGRAKLNKAVQTIPLPSSDYDPKPGTICTVAGWGMTTSPLRNRPGNLPSALMEVNVTVIRREICNDKEHYNGKPVITKNMICAGAKNKDSCHGDSGGPLRCNNIMRGITSFGKKKCGKADGPGVYTRLTKQHLKWIRKTIGGA